MGMSALNEVLSLDIMRNILNGFFECTGLRGIIVGADGYPIVVPDSSPEDCEYCQLIQRYANGREKCYGSYKRAGEQASQFGEPYIFRCHAGLIEWAVPLLMDGYHVGSIICGQVLMWEPEEFFWIEIAEMNRRLKVDTDYIIEAAKKLKVVSCKKVEAAANLLFNVANHIMATSMLTLEQRRKIKEQQALLNEEINKRKMLEKLLRDLDEQRSAQNYLDKEKELCSCVRLADDEGSHKILQDILADLIEKYGSDPEMFKIRVYELQVMISRAAVEGGAKLEFVSRQSYQQLQKLNSLSAIDEICLWIVENLEYFLKQVKGTPSIKNKIIIENVLRFIKNNYKKPIGLEEIAQSVYLSPYYLSHLFKNEMGCTVMEYLTKYRVEKAKKMLQDSNNSIEKISQNLGFHDASHFAKVFKKVEGVTPSIFKKKYV